MFTAEVNPFSAYNTIDGALISESLEGAEDTLAFDPFPKTESEEKSTELFKAFVSRQEKQTQLTEHKCDFTAKELTHEKHIQKEQLVAKQRLPQPKKQQSRPFERESAKSGSKKQPPSFSSKSSGVPFVSKSQHSPAKATKGLEKPFISKSHSTTSQPKACKASTSQNKRADSFRSRFKEAFKQKETEQTQTATEENDPLLREREDEKHKEQPEQEASKEKIGKVKQRSFFSGKLPQLEHYKIGLFPLYYMLDKLNIKLEAKKNFMAKQESEYVAEQMDKFHKMKLEAMREAVKKEKEASKWGILQQVASMIASLVSIVMGIVLICTGVSAVAGALLLAAGIIQIASQIMHYTGAWNKITHALPGDDPEKKKAIVTWIQIGISVLCLILGGIGIVFGGFSSISETASLATRLIGGFALIAGGVGTLGEGVNNYHYKHRLSDVKKYEAKLAVLRHRREDLLDILEHGLDRLKKLFEMLVENLSLEDEIMISYQAAWK